MLLPAGPAPVLFRCQTASKSDAAPRAHTRTRSRPSRSTRRTVLRAKSNSRAICLIDLLSTKCARLTRAIVSTASISPTTHLHGQHHRRSGGSILDADHPTRGSIFNADPHMSIHAGQVTAPDPAMLQSRRPVTPFSSQVRNPGRRSSAGTGWLCWVSSVAASRRKRADR